MRYTHTEIKERKEVVRSMHHLISELNNEDAYLEWISAAVPDCPCDEDYENIAEDEELFTETIKSFNQIWDNYISDGLYIGNNLYEV